MNSAAPMFTELGPKLCLPTCQYRLRGPGTPQRIPDQGPAPWSCLRQGCFGATA